MLFLNEGILNFAMGAPSLLEWRKAIVQGKTSDTVFLKVEF